MTSGRVGVFAIGLEAYWEQFPGLRERLQGYLREVERRVVSTGVEVVSAGLVDTASGAAQAGALFARSDLDLVLCHVATYETSSQVLPVVQRAKAPVLVLNLQPSAALDYENADTGEWLAQCSTCSVPELSNAFARAHIPFRVISGMLYEDERAWGEIAGWCRAAGVVRTLAGSRIGFLGHTYPGMLDLYSDLTMVSAGAGAHIEVLEMCDLDQAVNAVTDAEVESTLAATRRTFHLENVDEADLEWAARVSAGLDRMVERFNLQGLTYYYRGLDGNRYERLSAGLILGNSLLTARGIPASGEGDLKNCVAMKIMDCLGAGGSFTEFYAMDFRERFVLMGHDGPAHLGIGDRKPVLRGLGLYHGKRGSGVSVEFNVKTGPVTVLAMTQTVEGKLKFLAAEGEAIAGPTLKIGNTNSRLRFPLGPAEFVDEWCRHGPTHHCALGVGHVSGALEKVAELMKVPLKLVC